MVAIEGDGGGGTPAIGLTTGRSIAWGILFLTFVAMTDMPALAEVGGAFAWLFLVSVMLKYGPQAFANIKTFNTTAT